MTAPAVTATTTADPVRTSTRFGLAFTVCQLLVMIAMAVFVLPHGGAPSDPAMERGQSVQEAAGLYRAGNFAFMAAGSLLLGFLGAVWARLRRADASGVLATVAVASGVLLALIWPLAGMLHDVALETAAGGADPRILAGWDAVAPYGLAFSVFARVFFVGAIALGLRATGRAPWLVRSAAVVVVLSLVGSATLVSGALFPLLALSTFGYELWVAALAWHWLRDGR
ncbi:hypothetical protein KZZ52_32330 [Dactylosporangium sp. AC04546]|uniref:hypothetical protein n=1 Tax=Dactylosporangium sp. AC04546 TaxID=2862460 RepID=UPI001EDFC900|nr:hypothetical protein [Dactylosporangium sp. AC04546]WVK78679.1 hypothetical protein KZZ52_32330 [Dactylosporangium sp. AC04546]